MTKPSTPSIHSDGWWDHMPPGHDLNIIMNAAELPSSSDGSMSRPARRIKRSHAKAWILLAAACATGGALAMAAVRDPQSLREHLDSALAEVKNLTGSSSTATSALTKAPDAVPAPTPVQEMAPVTTAQATAPATSHSPAAPLPPMTPAAGRSETHAVPVTAVIKPLAILLPSTSKEPLADSPQVVPSLPPRTELAPVQPLLAPVQPLPSPSPLPLPLASAQPVVQPPPVVTPLIVPPPVEVAPPPVQAPASSPQ